MFLEERRMFERQGLLVTGGTSGIGLAIAVAFAEAGVQRIAIIGRNAERGTHAVGQIAKSGAAVRFIQADANYPDQARSDGTSGEYRCAHQLHGRSVQS